MLHISPRALVPTLLVSFVDAVTLAALRNANVLVRQQEFAERRIEGEAMHSAARGVDEHRARAVDDVSRGDLVTTLLEAIFQLSVLPGRPLAMDGEDRAEARVDVDVGRAVERVEQQHVLPPRILLGNRDQTIGLFR